MTKLPPAARTSRNVFPPSVLSSNTPPSKPTLGSISDASRLKLCWNASRAQHCSKNEKENESSRLSLTTAGSSMNAALGGVSAGGIGTPELDVTQSGGGPSAFVANHPTGNAGGVTLSKFSLDVCRDVHGGHLPPLRIWAAVGRMGMTPMPTAMSKSSRPIFRNPVGVNVRLGLAIITANLQPKVYASAGRAVNFISHSLRPTTVNSVYGLPR